MIDRGVAVITGAASGIGRALSVIAGERGFKIYLVDVDAEMLKSTAAQIHTNVELRVLDVCDHASMDLFAREVFAQEGRVDLLFNNAGILRGGLSWEIDHLDWRKTIDVNLMGVVNGVTSFVGRMIASGLPCRIVNTASIGGLVAAPMLAPYAASKSAVIALTQALDVELQVQHSKVRAHVVAPGPVKSSIYANAASSQSAANADAVSQMRHFTEQTGTDPRKFAEFVFHSLENDEFWILSHPELWENALQASAERILARVRPHPAHFNLAPG